jgi:dTMP kinase
VRLVALIGIDGSGKSSLSEKLAEHLQASGVNAVQVKHSAGNRHPILSGIYAAVWIIDYTLQMYFRVLLRLLVGKTVIADRYIYDQALNISLATGWSERAIYRMTGILAFLTPNPDAVILVDTPEEVCWARKDDVPSIEYLRERRSVYLAMAERYGFHVLDGRRSPEELLDDALARCFDAGPARPTITGLSGERL